MPSKLFQENKPRKRAVRALVLFSGGLDSILAVKIVEQQGIETTALTFAGYFFDAAQAEKSARENNIKLITRDFSESHFEIIKNPKFGLGVGMNPCIDCHLLMLKEAKRIATQKNFDIIATGEVLGQRPMSQNIEALKLIEREAGLVGKILRPLSARALAATDYEKKGFVSRENLPNILGRSRKEQMELAKKYNVENYPTPAGGCILTDKEYSKKLSMLLKKIKNIRTDDIALLRIGRHSWSGDARIIIGRNHEENIILKNIRKEDDVLVEPKNVPGPSVLVRGKISNEEIVSAKKYLVQYTKNNKKEKIEFAVTT